MNPFDDFNLRLDSLVESQQRTENLLLDLLGNPDAGKPSETFLTVSEAAAFLRLSVSRVYTLISQKELPVIKRTKRCYFLKADLVNYLKEGRKKSTSEISIEAEAFLANKKGLNNG